MPQGDEHGPDRQPIPIELGRPEELDHFANRNAAFIEVYPRLCAQVDMLVARRFIARDPADKVVFMLGRLAVEDFNEIFLVSGYGRGAAGLKLLRSMFETSVTMHYIARHPDEAKLYLDYHYVHQRKTLKVAESTGLDISYLVPLEGQAEVERMYQSVKDKYLRACPGCDRQTVGPSWHEKDITTMAREAGLEKSILGSYLLPTFEIHSTPVKLLKRLERTPDAILFNSEARRAEADSALAGAHLCVTEILTEHNRHFGLGLASLAQDLEADLMRAWGNRPDMQVV